jgi:hypothetical protein
METKTTPGIGIRAKMWLLALILTAAIYFAC